MKKALQLLLLSSGIYIVIFVAYTTLKQVFTWLQLIELIPFSNILLGVGTILLANSYIKASTTTMILTGIVQYILLYIVAAVVLVILLASGGLP